MASDFDDWYRSSYAAVLAACRAMSGDDQQACEATDEAFARAFARWNKVAALDSPVGWTCSVGFNTLRRSWRRRLAEDRWVAAERPQPVGELGASDPDIWAAVRALPPRQRTAVVLRYVADLPEAEIARSMGIARGTVAASLAAARAHLSETLNHPDKEVPCG